MQNLDKKALKSGFFYTFSNFLTKGIVFLTTPLFSRIMSEQAFGAYSAFITWQTLLLCVLPLGLDTTVNRARLDFPDKLEQYLHEKPGAISPMGLIFDEKREVTVLMDAALREQPRLAFHPCVNTASLAMSSDDFFEKFLKPMGYEPIFVTIHDFMD